MNDVVLLTGRVLFGMFFIMSGYNHVANLGMMAQYAGSQGVPAPKLAVGATGLMLLAGGASVLLGFQPRFGALLLVLFLVPTAVIMHRFWGLTDAGMAMNQRIHFWKNITLAGAALMIYYFASIATAPWPYSVGR